VLSQGETPGYGDRILEVKEGEKTPWFTRQFNGRKVADNIALKTDGGAIDAITGATITSRAVTTAVNTTVKQVLGQITGKTYTVATTVKSEEPDDIMAQLMSGAGEDEPEDDAPDDLMAQLMGDKESAEKPSSVPSESDLGVVLTGMTGGFVKTAGASGFEYWTGYTDAAKKTPGGYAFIAKGEGFASTIQTLVGVGVNGKIVGTKVIFQEETPGYGDRILEVKEGEKSPWFTSQFMGKSGTVALKADGGAIDAITGATISSKAVTSSIDAGLKQLSAQKK
jgi:electron transport complex protein RnfG